MRRVARIVTVPAPVGGLNVRDSLAAMGKNDAVILDNFVPQNTELRLRAGSANHVTGITGTPQTLAVYNKADGTNQMFAVSAGSVYDVTSPGAVGAAIVSGLSNSKWQDVNFSTAGGKFLMSVNGADLALLYDGTSWTNPAITGVSSATLINVTVFQRRLWFVQKDTTKAWYLPVESIAGAAQAFDLGSLFSQGGYLMAIGTWTLDSGTGMDDHAVFISSEGEVAVYRGIDPASSATWYLVGVYTLGAPVGRRCVTSYGSDALIISKDGVLPFTKALQNGRTTTAVGITDKIQQAISDATTLYGDTFGWEIQVYPEENLVILNVPVSGGSQQYVMYALNGSWCRFTGWDASCFARMGSSLYFATAGKIMKAWTGATDNGSAILGEALSSFQYHGGMALKRYTLARPVISFDESSFGILMSLNLDFDQTPPTGTPTLAVSAYGLWDTALWDFGIWGGGFLIRKNWQTVGGVGYCAGLHIKINSSGAIVKWQSVDYIFEIGDGFV